MPALTLLQTLAPHAPTAFAAVVSLLGGAMVLGPSVEPVLAALGHHFLARA